MTKVQNTFDNVVIGAGSAGCVLAAPLSESGRHRVLLVEAGYRDRNAWMEAPEQKSLTEAAEESGRAGVKIRQQMAFVEKRQGLGDEGRLSS